MGRGSNGGRQKQIVMSEKQFLSKNVGVMPTSSLVRSVGRMSKAALKRARADEAKLTADWLSAQNAARKKYASLVSSGRMRPPTRIESLKSAASSGNAQQAAVARRLLKKYGF